MSIRLLEVEGFKSLKEVSWRPGNLNVIIGPNGSGKSNLVLLLDLIRAAAAGKLGEFVQQEGGISALIWDGRERTINLNVEVQGEWVSFDFEDHLHYKLTLEAVGESSRFYIPYEQLESFGNNSSSDSSIEIIREEDEAFVYDTRANDLVAIDTKRIPVAETLLSSLSPFSAVEVSSFNQQLQSWSIYKGLDTGRNAPIRQAVLTRRETTTAPDGENLVAVLHTLYTEDRNFRNELNSAMRAAFSDSFEELIFPPAADQRVQLRVNWKHLKRSQPSAMLSDGTLRFLYLMAILANPEPPALIAIEEPEVGLHPSMFPIIAEYAVQASKRTQVIFTTHSADFLDAFRDTGVAPTTTVTQWRDGATTLKVLEGDELAYWLREYTLGQLFRSSELEQIG
jgi:predicted ATPase